MKAIRKYLPLFTALAIHFCFSALNVSSSFSDKEFTFYWYLELPFLISFALILIVTATILSKKNIWAFLFLLYLILSFFPFLSFGIMFTLTIGSLPINMISLILLIWHYVANSETFQIDGPKNEEIERRIQQKKSIFERQYEKKTLDELQRINASDLVPEAKEVLAQMIQKKKNLS